jgi:glyoxalase family protein
MTETSVVQTSGIHHVTAIAGHAQENLDFYAGVLGMRLVKRSVNQDDPGTYHLFYADAEGRPGTDLTFFPWARMAPKRPGVGLTAQVALAVPEGSLEKWTGRLEHYGVKLGKPEVRFGERTLPFRDPHGLELTLMETADERPFTPWSESPVLEKQQVRGIHGVRLWERDLATTAAFLTQVMGFEALGREGQWHRFGLGTGSGRWLEVRELPDARRGQWGTGSVHHVAWRVADEEEQLALRQRIFAAGRRPTEVIDRFWFHSVYFMEPGGALFEIATDGPGFSVDEDTAHLGEKLILPPWLEAQRAAIESVLPALAYPPVAELQP